MTRLWLVRHGPTHARAAIGWTDLPADLSDSDAVARLDAYLPRPARLISSDLIRAHETANRVAAGRQRLPDEADLREIHFGAWEGLDFGAIAARDGALSRQFWEDPGPQRAPDGESFDDVVARVWRVVEALCKAEQDAVVVCHMGAIMAALARASDMSLKAVMRFSIEPLSVTGIEALGGGGWRILGVNHKP